MSSKDYIKGVCFNIIHGTVAILFILSCPHDLTWVLPHIRMVVALGSYYLAFDGRLGTFPSPLLSDEAL